VSDVALRRAIAALALLGLAVASYLTVTRMIGEAPVCTTGGCAKVQSSDYAEVLGIPVAVLGLLAYAALLVTALRAGPAPAAIGAGIAVAGVAFAGYLLWVQAAVLEAFCLWCLVSDAVIAVIAPLAVWRLVRESRAAEAA
jgi:uncharacterized membrane protein